MLPETRQAVSHLKQAGFTREQFCIRTPWNEEKGAGKTTIELRCSLEVALERMHRLAEHFKTIVTCLDGMPCHVAIEVTDTPALYKRENGKEEKVTTISFTRRYEQLSLWEAA